MTEKDEQREKHVQKLKKAIKEMKASEGIHKRDMIRYCWRLKNELAEYDMYHNLLNRG